MEFVAPNDFLVLEKATGSVRRVTNGVLSPTLALDVAVNSSSERGLLGIAVNSADPARGLPVLHGGVGGIDNNPPLGNRVYRYTWNPSTGLLQSPQLILDLPVTPGPNHNGGVLVMGSPSDGASAGDGAFLYVVIGELNRNGKLQNNGVGADPDDTGVILRIQQDGTPAAGNPFTPYCSGATTLTCDDDADCGGNGPCVLEGGALLRLRHSQLFRNGARSRHGLALDDRERAERLRRGESRHAGDEQRLEQADGARLARPAGPGRSVEHAGQRARPTAIRSSPGSPPSHPRASCCRPEAAWVAATTTWRSSATATWDSSTRCR